MRIIYRSKLHASRTPETLKILKTSVVNQWKLFIPRWTVSNLSIFVAPICTTKRDIRRASSFPIDRRKSRVYPIRDPFLRANYKTNFVSLKQKVRSFRFERSELWNYLIYLRCCNRCCNLWLNFICESNQRWIRFMEKDRPIDWKNIYIYVVVEFLSEERSLRSSRISRGWFISELCCASQQIPIYTLTGRNNLLTEYSPR